MKKTANTTLVAALGASLLPGLAFAQAQQTPIPESPGVAPQIELAGTGIGTLQFSSPRFTLPSGARSSTSGINLSDSALLLGISERLYRKGGIGSFVVGTTTTESEKAPSGTEFFIHQLYVNYQSRTLEGTIGRTDSGTHLIEFPTIRGDELNEFVNALNPFSSGANIEEHRYSNQASITLNSGLRSFVNVHAQNLITSTPNTTGQAGINSFGVSYQYHELMDLQPLKKVPIWGFGYERQTIGQAEGGPNNLLYAGIVYNIAPDPIDRVDLRLQDIYSFGNNTRAITNVNDTFRASANTIAGSLRWLHSPFGVPGYQVSLTAGYRSYNRAMNANTLALALTGVKRLGGGFDLVAEYIYQHRDTAYASAYSGVKDEHSVQLGFVFNFNNTFNKHLGPRRSLLNMQHQYVPD